MSHAIPSSSHLNALVVAMVQHAALPADEAWMLHYRMHAESHNYVASYYAGRDHGLVPQSLNDADYPFDPDMDIAGFTDKLPGMIGQYLDNSMPVYDINSKLDAMVAALQRDDPAIVAPDKAERFALSNGQVYAPFPQ